MRIRDRLLPISPGQIGTDHFADHRSWPDDGHLDHQIVKAFGLHARQRRHLRTGFHLKDADSVCGPQHGIDLGVICGKFRVVNIHAVIVVNKRRRILQHGQHAKAKQIHFHDAEVGTVVLVPLNHYAAGHACRLQRNDFVEPSGRNHHAARVLAQVARQIEQRGAQFRKQARARLGRRKARLFQECRQGPAVVQNVARQKLTHASQLFFGKSKRPATVAHRHAWPIGDHVRGHGGTVATVFAVHVLNHLFALVARRQIEIDVGHAVGDAAQAFHALFRQEALEK